MIAGRKEEKGRNRMKKEEKRGKKRENGRGTK
jgi:hypothetical protein